MLLIEGEVLRRNLDDRIDPGAGKAIAEPAAVRVRIPVGIHERLPAVWIFLRQIVQAAKTVILGLIGVVKIYDVGGVVIPGGIVEGGRRFVISGGVSGGRVLQVIRGMVELGIDDNL